MINRIHSQPSFRVARLGLSLGLLALPLLACQGVDPAESLRGRRVGELIRIEPAMARSAATANLRDHASEVFAFLRFVEQSEALSPLFGTSCVETEGEPCGSFNADDARLEEEMSEIADAFLADDLIIESSGQRIVYRIDRQICDGDSDCLDLLTRFEPRLIATARRPGDIDIDLVFGEEETLLALFDLHFDDLTLALELAPARAIVQSAFAGDADLERLAPDVADGLLVIRLGDIGTGFYQAELSAPRGLLVESEAGDYRLQVGASNDPWISIEYDEELQAVHARIDSPTMDLDLPSEAFGMLSTGVSCFGTTDPEDESSCEVGSELPEGTIRIHLAGLSGAIELGASAPLAVTGLSLGSGPSTIRFNNLPILTVELNRSLGHVLDLEVVESGSLLRFSPGLELEAEIHMSNFGPTVETPAWTLNDTSKLSLTDGASAPALRLFFEDENPNGAIAEVISGTVELRSTSIAAPVSISEGQCVFVESDIEDNVHPFSTVTQGPCQ
jgi:hypothetical protein